MSHPAATASIASRVKRVAKTASCRQRICSNPDSCVTLTSQQSAGIDSPDTTGVFVKASCGGVERPSNGLLLSCRERAGRDGIKKGTILRAAVSSSGVFDGQNGRFPSTPLLSSHLAALVGADCGVAGIRAV